MNSFTMIIYSLSKFTYKFVAFLCTSQINLAFLLTGYQFSQLNLFLSHTWIHTLHCKTITYVWVTLLDLCVTILIIAHSGWYVTSLYCSQVDYNHLCVAGNGLRRNPQEILPIEFVDYIKNVYSQEIGLQYIYFGSEEGVIYNYPSVNFCSDDYDPRFR